MVPGKGIKRESGVRLTTRNPELPPQLSSASASLPSPLEISGKAGVAHGPESQETCRNIFQPTKGRGVPEKGLRMLYLDISVQTNAALPRRGYAVRLAANVRFRFSAPYFGESPCPQIY
jgi:hypothetical protein